MGDESFSDNLLSVDEFWERAEQTPNLGTSQPPVGQFVKTFEQAVRDGYQVLCLTVTGKHSGTFTSAWSAARRFAGRVSVLDSLSLSVGQGWQAVQAARMALRGLSLEEITANLDAMRDRLNIYIQLETLENIRKGGRIAALMPIVDRVTRTLHVKALLNVVDGEIKLMGMARSRKAGLNRLVAEIKRSGPHEMIQVMHIRAHERAEALVEALYRAGCAAVGAIGIAEAGTVLATHGGPGLIGVIGLAERA